MVGQGGSSAGSYLADPTSPIPSHCASIVAPSTLSVNDGDNSLRHILFEHVTGHPLKVYHSSKETIAPGRQNNAIADIYEAMWIIWSSYL